jgi:hypothetical protein
MGTLPGASGARVVVIARSTRHIQRGTGDETFLAPVARSRLICEPVVGENLKSRAMRISYESDPA